MLQVAMDNCIGIKGINDYLNGLKKTKIIISHTHKSLEVYLWGLIMVKDFSLFCDVAKSNFAGRHTRLLTLVELA